MSGEFFEEPKVSGKPIILIAGPEGTGKTHFAATFPDPLVFLDTEGRAGRVLKKFKKRIYYKKVTGWNEIRQAAKILPELQAQTFIIDSASDLRQWADKSWLADKRAEKVHPIHHWTFVNQMLDGFLTFLQKLDVYVVLTARMKREYVDDRFTGRMVSDIYHKYPYKADIVLEFKGEEEGYIVRKSAFDENHVGMGFQWPEWKDITSLIR